MLKPTKKWRNKVLYVNLFTVHIVNNKGADQTVRMRRLVCAFVVHKQQYQGFSRHGPYDVKAQASGLRLATRLLGYKC